MNDSQLNNRRLVLEKSFKDIVPTQIVLDIVEYIALRKRDCYKRVLQTMDQTELSLLSGELRAYQKLLDVLTTSSLMPTSGTATIN